MKHLSLVIFDCDGVLVDSEPVAAIILRDYLAELGLPLRTDEVDARYRGRSLRDCRRLIEAELGREIPEDFIPELNRRTYAAFHDGLQPIAGIREVLVALESRNLPRCVASSGGLDKMQLTLGLTGLLPYLSPHLFSASMVQNGKPAPDLFLHAAKSMGHLPQSCLVVEDSLPGVRAGIAAGMTVVGYAPPDCPPDARRDLEAEGVRVIAAMSELLAVLES